MLEWSGVLHWFAMGCVGCDVAVSDVGVSGVLHWFAMGCVGCDVAVIDVGVEWCPPLVCYGMCRL